jgi:hypothetical protein
VNLCFERSDDVGKVFKRFVLPREELKCEPLGCFGADSGKHLKRSDELL